MRYLDLPAIAAAPVRQSPFDHMLVDCALTARSVEPIEFDYPTIAKPGSFALADLDIGPAIRGLVDELAGDEFRSVMAEKFDVDLAGRPAVFTLRGACAAKDGQIHTDSKSKILSVLLYLNSAWAPDGGRLRLLRGGDDIEDYACEIAPIFGRLLAFRRSDNSWHGHKSYAGPRRVLQMNYVVSAQSSILSNLRHRFSALAK